MVLQNFTVKKLILKPTQVASKAFEERQFMEQIMLDPIENVYEKFQTTVRSNQSLFRNGFLIYKY